MRAHQPPLLLRALLLAATVIAISACTSGADSVTTDSSLPTTTDSSGQRSDAPDPVATIDPTTATTVVQPEATTTTTTTSTTTTTAPPIPDGRIDPVFTPVLERLLAESGVPIRLPQDAGLGGDSDIVATLSHVDQDGYLIHLGFGPECDGGNVCRVSTFSGFVLDPTDDRDEDAAPGLIVPLPAGTTGWFFDATCGANCGDGTVEWLEDGVRYTVGEKLGPGPEMLALAWQSIDPTATAPAGPIDCRPDPVRDAGRGALVEPDPDGHDLHWLAVCSADGIRLTLIDEPGQLTWFDFDSNGERDLALTHEDGSTTLFSVVGIDAQPLMDFDSFGRLRVDDLRCRDMDGDGSRELVDALDGSVFEFINPISVVRSGGAEDAFTFDRCF